MRARAAVMRAFGEPFTLEEIELDEPGPGELLVRTVASGICHSDITIWQGGLIGTEPPMILGHEAAGVVVRVGDGVTVAAPGDRVVTTPSAFCGRCEWCIKGRPYRCPNKQFSRPEGSTPRLKAPDGPLSAFVGLGGFASHMLVSERAVAKIPHEMPLDRASLLGCGFTTGFGAVVNTAQVSLGDKVAVIGCGGVGLSAVQAARLSNASCVIAVDRMPHKLELARALGATHTIDASTTDPVQEILAITGDGLDHAFEAIGYPETIQTAFAALREGGTVTVIGFARPGDVITIPAQAMIQEKKLQGSRMGSNRFGIEAEAYSRLYLDGRLDLDSLISNRISLDGLNDAFADFGSADHARTVIEFDPADAS
jgi:S-(hydroxymethyl)glutathione dehydrogenase/alcohol dehydrogenase